jgi:hypothetical protein
MSFTVTIRGIEVSCSTLDELDKLLAHPVSIPTIKVTPGRRPDDNVHKSAAWEIREAMGEPKPNEAEWTWEHAVEMIRLLGVSRDRWKQGLIAHSTPGKLAEQIVYAITKSLAPSNTPKPECLMGLFTTWELTPQIHRAEIVTLWIERAQAILEGKS